MRTPDIVKMVFGSHLYGLNTESSDYDYKGIYKPTLREIILYGGNKSFKTSTGNPNCRNKPGDIDFEVLSLKKFIDLAIAGDTLAIDMLHCTNPILTSDEWEFIRSNRTRFYTKSMNSYTGYLRRQAGKYGIRGSRLAAYEHVVKVLEKSNHKDKLSTVLNEINECEHIKKFPKEINKREIRCISVCGSEFHETVSIQHVYESVKKRYEQYGHRAQLAKENKGIDWKAISHALRAGYQMRGILVNGDFEYPLNETGFLLDVKLGKLDFLSVVQPELEKLETELHGLVKSSTLPEAVDTDFWYDWLVKQYNQ